MDAMAVDIIPDPLSLPWRVGTKNGRTLYAHAGTGASREDVMIGVMDTPELAQAAVDAHNSVTPHPGGF